MPVFANPIDRPASPWQLCVAPMMDWTDRHCRAFHRILAPHAHLYTEMVHAEAVRQGNRERLLEFDASEHPVALQLGGSEPRMLAEAARIGAEWGYDEINLNIGCPSDRVQAGRFGACLMREPQRVGDCIATMQAAVAVPVTVKCRLGVDNEDDDERLYRFIDTVAAAGCRMFIVHARKAWLSGLSPKENREIPPLQYERVHRLRQDYPHLTIVLNGGLTDIGSVLAHKGRVDGVMIGRAAWHDPYFLHRLERALFDSKSLPVSREALLCAYRPYAEAMLACGVALKHLIPALLGLFHGEPGGRAFRRYLSEQAHRPGAGWVAIEQAVMATREREPCE